jgi:hypothetical protein
VGERGEIHQHSGWLIPLGVVLVILALSGMLLLYYLRPAPGAFRDRPIGTAGITLAVRGTRFRIPASYLEAGGTHGGDVDVVAMSALLPDMRGYSPSDNSLFARNAADSPVLHLLIKADTNSLDAASRFERIYKPYIQGPNGRAGPFGLTRYTFRVDSGYGRDDLFVGDVPGLGTLLLLCEQPAQDISSPNCLAIDRPIAPGVTMSYRFKRAQLANWRQISGGADRLISGFLVH